MPASRLSGVPTPTRRATRRSARVLVIGCGALARELLALTKGIPGVKVDCVDARLHMRPGRIADAVADRIAETRAAYGDDVRIFVAYADCGTGGALDAVLEREGIERIAGRPLLRVLRRRGGLRGAPGRGARARST